MKRMISILGIMGVTCLMTITACASSGEKKRVEKKHKTTLQQKNKPVAVGDTIKSFRYELYTGDASEIFYYTHTASINSSHFYTRNMGSNTGWTYTANADPVMPLSQLAAELKLDQYPDGDLDNEERSRDRWIVIVEYTNGKEKTVCTYTDNSTAANDKVVREKAEAAFKAIKIKDKDGNMMGEYTKSTYVDGKLIKEINYTQDGIVHGGRDYTEPNDMEYALPPKTY